MNRALDMLGRVLEAAGDVSWFYASQRWGLALCREGYALRMWAAGRGTS